MIRTSVGLRTYRPQIEVLEGRLLPSTYLVTTTANSGPGSLRQAIQDANTSARFDTVKFSIGSGVQTISPLSDLPAISDQVFIDGATQPGGEPVRIELAGGNPGVQTGLFLGPGSNGSIVRGLSINRFQCGIEILSGNNQVVGNYIGTDFTGTIAVGNVTGVEILGGASHNTVGGTTTGARNVISGNANGVAIQDAGTKANLVQGNYIGTDVTG